MSDSESDIEIKSALTKKKVKLPSSPSEFINNNLKKTTTKMMIKDALTELKSRKGVSLYAIKKHLVEKYQVDTVRLNYMIKKTLKLGVEDGTFIQLKGVGASGSFKLAVVKDKVKPIKKKIPKPQTILPQTEQEEKPAKKTKQKKVQIMVENKDEKQVEKKKLKQKKVEETKVRKKELEVKVSKMPKGKEVEKQKKPKTKEAKLVQTPAKKKTLIMRRKSSGSVIKPPKMKPKKK